MLSILFSLSLVSGGCKGQDRREGITLVWAVDETEKVRRDDLKHWAKTSDGNHLWDGTTIRIFGARNEVVGCQVILEAAGTGAQEISLSLDSLAGPGYTLANAEKNSSPFSFVGKRIEIFTESYINVRSRFDWWLWPARPLPDDLHTGWIPDPLVPCDGAALSGRGGFPCSIPPGSNQGVWIDVYIPKDAPPGIYRGEVRIQEGSKPPRRVPVELKVYGFTLPDETHLHNHVFTTWPPIVKRHGAPDNTADYWKVFRNYANVFHRHRLDLTDGHRTLDTFSVHLAGYYTGEWYSPGYGYEGPGMFIGNRTYSIGTYDQPNDGWRSGFFPDDPGAWQRAADRWEEWFRKNAPAVVRFKYMEDEPSYSRWPGVIRKADWIRASNGPGRFLDILVTTRIGEELKGHVTFFMVTGQSGWADSGGTTGYDLKVVASTRREGYKVGFYGGGRPSFGDPFPLDDFASDARVNPWIAWKYNADQYFLWETAYYADYQVNGWAEAYPGTIVYTGEDKIFPQEDRGIPGPIVSLRLKNLRRGMQDYEYFWLAREAGIDVSAIIDKVVPHAFNDYSREFVSQAQQPTWATRGSVYESARREIAERLSSITPSPSGGVPNRPPEQSPFPLH